MMCGYICKGFYHHHVTLGDNVGVTIGVGVGQTVCVFVLFCFLSSTVFTYAYLYLRAYIAFCIRLTRNDY